MRDSRLLRTFLGVLAAASVTQFCFSAMSAPAAETLCAAPVIIGDGWEVSTPDASGFDAATLCATLASVAAGNANIHGVVVERHGRLVAELYRKGPDLSIDFLYGLWHPFAADTEFGPTTLHDLRSISKSVVGLLIGIARRQDKIGSLATPHTHVSTEALVNLLILSGYCQKLRQMASAAPDAQGIARSSLSRVMASQS